MYFFNVSLSNSLSITDTLKSGRIYLNSRLTHKFSTKKNEPAKGSF